MELRIDGVDVFNPLEGKLDDVIECFVEFYGERHRESITQKIKDTKFLFLPVNGFKSLKSQIESHYNSKLKELDMEILSKYTSDLDKMKNFLLSTNINNVKSTCEQFYSGKENHTTQATMNQILTLIGVLKTRNEQAQEKAQELGIREQSDEFFDLLQNFHHTKLNIEELKEVLNKPDIKNQVEAFVSDIQEQYYSSEMTERRNNIEQDKQFAFEQVKEYDENIEQLDQKHSKEADDFLHEHLGKLVDLTLYDKYEIQNLEKNYSELIGDDFNDKIKDSLFVSSHKKKRYVEFFKTCGFDYGEILEDYLNKLDVQDTIFNPQVIKEYTELRINQLLEIINSNEFFGNALDTINEINASEGSLEAMQTIYNFMQNKGGFGACIFNLLSKDDNLLKSVMICPYSLGYLKDHIIIHELGHVIESVLVNQNNELLLCSGFDFYKLDTTEPVGPDYNGKNLFEKQKESSETPKEKRQYESMNEIINDYFSEQVGEIIHNKGMTLNFGEQNFKSIAFYRHGFDLLTPFIEKYKEELIEARLSNNPLSFKEVIGEKNFDLLAQTCEEHLSMYSNINKMINIKSEIRSIQQEYNCSFDEALRMPIEWSNNAQEYINHFKTVDKILEHSNQKEQNNEIDMEFVR